MADARKRERWAARRAAGLCGECGQVPSHRYARCGLCRELVNEYRRQWWKHAKQAQMAKRIAAYWQNPEPVRARERRYYHERHAA